MHHTTSHVVVSMILYHTVLRFLLDTTSLKLAVLTCASCQRFCLFQVAKEFAEAIKSGMSASPQLALAFSIPLQALLGAFHGGHLCADPDNLGPTALNLELRKQFLDADLPTHLPALLTAVTTMVEAAPLPASARPAPGHQRIKRSPATHWELPHMLLVRSTEAFLAGWHTLALFSMVEEFPTAGFEAIAQPTVTLGASILRMSLRYLVQLPADAVEDRGFVASMLSTTMATFKAVAHLICTSHQRLQLRQGRMSQQGPTNQPAQQADFFLQVMQSDGWSACACISTVIAARSLLLAQDVSAHLHQQAYTSTCGASPGVGSSVGSSSRHRGTAGSSGSGDSCNGGGGRGSSGGSGSRNGGGGSTAAGNLHDSGRCGSFASSWAALCQRAAPAFLSCARSKQTGILSLYVVC